MSKYKVSEPSALKFLKANGAVVDENGNVVNDATDYWKKVYDQAEPKVAKYLHADGTIDENPGSGGGGSDLENNKEVTITENGTIEITPTEGKDGMKKVTATVNVPSDAKEEQTKSVTITENGTTTVTPDSGKVLSSVSITTNVSGGGSSGYSSYKVFDVYFSALNDSASASTKVKNGDLIIIRPGAVLAETGGAKTEQSYYPSDTETAWTVTLGDSFTYEQTPNALTVSVANDGTLTATCSTFGFARAFTLLICHV